MTAGRDELRSEFHDALREEKTELSAELAATAGAVNDALAEVRELVVRRGFDLVG